MLPIRPALRLSLVVAVPLGASRPVTPAPIVPTVAGLRTEYQVDPLGIDALRPRVSWQLASTARNTIQSAYEIQVATDSAGLTHGAHLLWDSRRVRSGASVFVSYNGPPLQSAMRYYWRVRVWTAAGAASSWSTPAYWETGLLHANDWSAKWIGAPPSPADSGETPSPLLRREFTLAGRISSARLYVTSLGLNRVFLNGERVGTAELAPGWTSYSHRLQYQTYDVTAMLLAGANAVGAMLGDGWYRGYLGFDH
ncbi:MAG TPA: alpha-L-rhamnosidase N-terminal domain-containing protein, partial [Gemmatimonadaceae bacterium]